VYTEDPMQKMKFEKINVIAAFASFRDDGKFVRRITPIKFKLSSGDIHKVKRVRRSYTDQVGTSLHIHFVVVTTEDRYFDIFYDSENMYWYLTVELDERLSFDD